MLNLKTTHLIYYSISLLWNISLLAQVIHNPAAPLIENNPELYIDSFDVIKTPDVFHKTFHEFNYYFKDTPQALPVNTNIWLKYTVGASNPFDTTVYFYSGQQHSIEAYMEKNGEIVFVGKSGSFMPASQLSIPKNRLAIQIKIPRKINLNIYIRIYNYTAYHVDPFIPMLVSSKELNDYIGKLKQHYSSYDIQYAFCLGMFLIMFFYVLIKFFYMRDRTYLWYSFSIFFSFAYILLNYLHTPFHDYLFSENPLLLHIVSDPLLIIRISCYQLFINAFLDLKKNDPLLYKLIHGNVIFFLIYIVFGALYVYITRNLNAKIITNQLFAAILCLIAVFGFYRIYRIKTALSKILLAGIVCMTFFYFLSIVVKLAMERWNLGDPAGGILHLDLLLTGNLVEIFFFTLTLAYRERFIQRENLRFKEELIKQYQVTVKLQEEYSRELEKEVTQKTAEILSKNKVLEQERTEKIRADFNRMILESEMKALRAQMNPHFLFNCLSTIESYILQTKPQQASKLLQKFAMLTRLILENSRMPYITVSKELEALEIYIDVERERSDYKFNCSVEVDDPSTLDLLIPPMLVQPLVENAVLHGLRPLQKNNGVLIIRIKKENNCLAFSIEDNGVGLKTAKEIKAKSGLHKSSYGIRIVKERLSLIWNVSEADEFLKIIEKISPDKGVLAEIYFPLHINN